MQDQPDLRQSLLLLLKNEHSATIAEMAGRLNVTYEAVRQHIVQLESDGWISGSKKKTASRGAGRPTLSYSLTSAGDHLFPKHYDSLVVELVSAVSQQIGPDAMRTILASLTEARVQQWTPLMQGKSLTERITALKDFYIENDQFTETDLSGGQIRLIERNCPFLNVAVEHPALCSVTVSTLARLLGFQVVREERFQSGDRRCVFRVLTDQPVKSDFRFDFESPSAS